MLIDLQGNNAASYVDAVDLVTAEDGYIQGNIEISGVDDIEVTNGRTFFDGIINPDSVNEGTLDIFADGKLILMNREEFGPAGVFIDDFTVQSDGTIGVEFTPSTAPGDYPVIDAVTADLDGTFLAVYQPGIYADNFTYEDVIDADTRTGEFAQVEDNSALLVTTAIYDGADNVDINVTRLDFAAVAGLTQNQTSAAGAIDDVYGALVPGSEFENLVANLFTLNDEQYPLQLNALAGAEYAQYLQSVLWSTSLLNRTITERMECGAGWNAGQMASVDGMKIQPVADIISQPDGCFTPGESHLWGSISGSWNEHDGDAEAAGYDETQFAFHVGADYAFTQEFYAGLAVGYLNSDMDFDWFGNTIDYDGFQAAAYAGYDTTTWYLRGIVSGGWYDGDSHRNIPAGPGELIDPDGDPDSSVLSFYGETGYRLAIGDETVLTPYLGLSVADADLDGFTENDPLATGGALRVHSADGDLLASVVGLRLGGDWAMGEGMFHPVLSVAWMHEFDDTRQSVDMTFDAAPPGADFTVVSAKTSRDSLRVGAGGTFDVGETVDFGLKYDGLFNSDYQSHSLIGSVNFKF